jgi:hypothetical protein
MRMINRKSFTAEDAEDAEEGQNKGTNDNLPESEPARVVCARRGHTFLLVFLRVLKGYSTLREGICVLRGECVFSFTPYPSASTHRIV